MFLHGVIQPLQYEKQNQNCRQSAGNFSFGSCHYFVPIWKDQHWLCLARCCDFFESNLAVQSEEEVTFVILRINRTTLLPVQCSSGKNPINW